MTANSLTDLRKLIKANQWVKGAVNYDEDLHFSTYYLRASCAGATAPLYEGYSCILAFYEDFNETYYLLEGECRSIAAAIVRRGLRQPGWLRRILQEIRRRSDALADIFPPQMSPTLLAGLSESRLLSLYRRHDRYHRALYRYARLPEALDRGVGYFTGYLIEHLRRRGVRANACDEVFAVLSHPVEPSILAQEMIEFDEIVQSARPEAPAAGRPTNASGRARMGLGPEVLKRLNGHREKWQFLSYHGYGRRELTTLDQYVDRLVKQAANPGGPGVPDDLRARCDEARQAREEQLERLGIDHAHRSLFKVFPEIGTAKLYRRYAQLRNFYGLDMLLAEIAQRVRISERTVRCMLPEEVIASLRSGRLVNRAIEERRDGCLYAVLSGREVVVSGVKGLSLRRLLQTPLPPSRTAEQLRGVVACRGQAAGPCKVIIRADDYRGDFVKGTIVVSESTDPDLVRFLASAGGVLTEQGGVTSHAAIICRELGVPTVIGIEGLLERVRDGDWVKIDAEHGLVTLLGANGTVSKPTPACLPSSESPRVIGPKAYNLGVVRSLGFQVPAYVLLDYEKARRWLRRPRRRNSGHPVEEALAGLGLSNGDRLALRSSAVAEDRQDGSSAGQYQTLLNIERHHVADALREFVAKNRFGRNGTAYRGSVIIQRMVEADCAGVCLTRDQRAGTGDALIIEMTYGSNEPITAGTTRPVRLVVDRLTGDILEEGRSRSHAKAPHADVSWLVRQFLTLESRFGKPLDIEWALAGQELYVLQARPIV
jgi:phosphohistidine swiveling domain-containing protein